LRGPLSPCVEKSLDAVDVNVIRQLDAVKPREGRFGRGGADPVTPEIVVIDYQTTGRDGAICIAAGSFGGAQCEDFVLVSGGRVDSLIRGRPYSVHHRGVF
jgi:hypothetical protein